MTVAERIINLIDSNNVKQKDFALAIGTKEQTVSAWRKRGSNPSVDLIVPISRFFDISVEYILTGENATKSAPHLTKDEKELLENYRLLDDKQKKAIISHSESLAELASLRDQESEKKKAYHKNKKNS